MSMLDDSTPAGPQVGLIGLGLLGAAIADRLLSAGFSIVGFDVEEACRRKLTQSGGEAADSAAAVLHSNSLVILSLPTSDTVAEVLNAAPLPSGLEVLDTTTGDPNRAELHARRLAASHGRYIETNVAGSSQMTREGRAVLLVGADEPPSTAAENALAAIATRRFHVGGVGAGSRFKLVHNLLLGLHRAVLAEGLTFAESLGFSPERTLEILQQTPAASDIMPTKGPKMVAKDFTPQATLSQHLKDVHLILELAQQIGTPVPLSELHATLLRRAEQRGYGDQDNSAVIEAFRK